MVSLWPWKGEDNSPASFEKALSTLSTKITQTASRLDTYRQQSRRFKALWTLYTTFAYLLYSIILALVLGWQNWGIAEYAAVVGGPILIFAVRTGATTFFDYRIAKTQRHLDDLQKQRDETIEKLKVATKYDSTQQLLEKYGGVESPKPSPRGPKPGDEKRTKQKPAAPLQQQHVARTGLPPPPTANIRRPSPPQNFSPAPSTPAAAPQSPHPLPPYGSPQNSPFPGPGPGPGPSPRPIQPSAVDEAAFAPNAFPAPGQYVEHNHWYDRLLDVLLGEDETQPKNRIVLICRSCRLVNGQAPPGVKTLEELGRWRCGSCGAWNGEESIAKKVLADIQSQAWEPVARTEADDASSSGADEAVIVAASDDDLTELPDDEAAVVEEEEEVVDVKVKAEPEQEQEQEPEPEPRRSKRGRPKKKA